MKKFKLAFACDHAGFQIKEKIMEYLQKKGHIIKDFGAFSQESSDYPDFAHPMASAVEAKKYDFGISFCGSGNGINMCANKHKGIRSAICWNVKIAELARTHNDANICSIPARFVSVEEAKEIISVFFISRFEGGRHKRRINKIPIL